jgi:hypothetical protein
VETVEWQVMQQTATGWLGFHAVGLRYQMKTVQPTQVRKLMVQSLVPRELRTGKTGEKFFLLLLS